MVDFEVDGHEDFEEDLEENPEPPAFVRGLPLEQIKGGKRSIEYDDCFPFVLQSNMKYSVYPPP